jgi:predicted transcriptional regulator
MSDELKQLLKKADGLEGVKLAKAKGFSKDAIKETLRSVGYSGYIMKAVDINWARL